MGVIYLNKKDCKIIMKLLPRGAGWLHMHLTIGEERMGFVISSALGDRFSRLLRLLYHLYPNNPDPEFEDDIYSWEGLCEWNEDKKDYEITEIINPEEKRTKCLSVYQEIPWKAELCWDSEGADCKWVIERTPNTDTDFNLTLHIKYSDDPNERCYVVNYKEFCYAVTKACTEVLKQYGFMGYHQSTYEEDIPMRYFIFLKAVALDRLDILELQNVEDEKWAYTTSFEKEMELILFDM